MRGPAVGAGLVCGLLADISIADAQARIIDGHTRLGVAAGDHAAIVWPLLCGMAKAKYYLLLCEPLTGDEAERIGLISLARRRGRARRQGRSRSPTGSRAAQPTRHPLDQVRAQQLAAQAGPTFDASLALEFLGFTGPEAKEGLAAHREKRAPQFKPPQ